MATDEPTAERDDGSGEPGADSGVVSGATGIEGSDAAALGMTPTPGLDPPVAAVDTGFDPPPAAFDDDIERRREAKPWSTSLAYQSPQVGVDADTHGDEEGHVGRAANEDVPGDQL